MRIARSLLVLLLALLVAACGGDGDGRSADGGSRDSKAERSSTRAQEPAGATVEAKLSIRLEHVGEKLSGAGVPIPAGIACDRSLPATCRGEVECPGADEALCRWLAQAEIQALLLEPAPKDEICTEIYGGPEVATVTGTIGERKVERTFSRTNGCEVNRFDTAAPLWTGEVPPPASGGTGGGATGMCLAESERGPDEPVSSEDPTCIDTPQLEPEVIDDPPEAFE